MEAEEKTALGRAMLIGVICMTFAALGFIAGAQYKGALCWLLVGAGCVWASIAITSWLVLMSPYGWFGRLGVWIDNFMQDDWPQKP